MTDNEKKHKPELIHALDENYSIAVKCLAEDCKYYIMSSPCRNEVMLNDFYHEHGDRND